jgi:hypothetical protein
MMKMPLFGMRMKEDKRKRDEEKNEMETKRKPEQQ